MLDVIDFPLVASESDDIAPHDGPALELVVHRIALDLNRPQEELLRRCAGIARFSWNWALDRWQQIYAAHQADPSLPRPNEAALRRELNAVKREAFPWILEAPKSVPQQAVKNLVAAFAAFYAHADLPFWLTHLQTAPDRQCSRA